MQRKNNKQMISKKRGKPPGRRIAKGARSTGHKAKRNVSLKTNTSRAHPTGALFARLVDLQARLRAPGGCPWDREQTHSSLKKYLIEEAYEVLDAIDSGGSAELAEELGDLLLQVIFHAELAREAGKFDINDVVSGIHEKMVRRHPHVFGKVTADSTEQVIKNWDEIKRSEKLSAAPSKVGRTAPASLLEEVPRSFPALLEAEQLTRKAAQIGFDWKSVEGILEKLGEEIVELRAAIKQGNAVQQNEEMGDILFTAVNIARFLNVNPELALKDSSLKFKRRFQFMESASAQANQSLQSLFSEQIEQLWIEAKLSSRGADAQ